MFTTKQYRDKAAEYQVRRDTAITPAQKREYQELEQRFTTLADNEQWLSDNYNRRCTHLRDLSHARWSRYRPSEISCTPTSTQRMLSKFPPSYFWFR